MLNTVDTKPKPKAPPKHKAKLDPKVIATASGIKAATDWLDKAIADAKNKISAPVVTLTPDMAAALLERNPANRSLSKTKIEDFVHDMKSGDWKLNGEPIIISAEGLLNDGQHRCQAVLQSGVPIQTVMIFGVARETRDTLDQGKNRMVGDYLSMMGKKNANHLATAARLLWQWQHIGYIVHARTGAGLGAVKPTRTEMVRLVEETPKLVKSLQQIYMPNAGRLGSIGMVAFCHFAFSIASNESAVMEFFNSLIQGAGLEEDDPRLYCRNRLLAERGTMPAGQKVELIFRTWNAWRNGEKRTKISLLGGELPLLES